MRTRLLLALWLALLGCHGEELDHIKAENQHLQAELSQSRAEIDRLTGELASAKAQVAKLAETEEGGWRTATEAERTGDADGVLAAYEQFLARFPTSQRVDEARKMIERLKQQVCAARLRNVSASLNLEDRSTYEAALVTLRELPGCSSKAVEEIRSPIADRLSAWPTVMSAREYQARHADMRGKRAIVEGKLTVNDYYGYLYSDRRALRSFSLIDQSGTVLNLFCERRRPACEQLFSSVASGGETTGKWEIEDAARFYSSDASGMGLIVQQASP